MKYSKFADAMNRVKFKRHDFAVDEDCFICTVCKQSTCIENSYSFMGKRLICIPCKQEHFESFGDCAKWLRGEIK